MSTSDQPQPSPDLSFGATWPSLDVFSVLAESRRVIPVVRRLMADAETPVGLYRKLAQNRPGTFLLESAEHGGVWSRYSIVGVASRATLTEKDGEAHWIGEPPVGVPTTGLATEALRDTVAALATDPIPGLPPLTGGMVGMISYDAVRRWEKVPATTPDVLHIPEIAMMLATDLAVLDHTDGSVLLIANAVNYDATDERVEDAWADAVARLDTMTRALGASAESTVSLVETAVVDEALGTVTTNLTRDEYEQIVANAKEDIRAGEVFQVVLSQRFSIPCPADALDVYRALRAGNPSPYMYLFRFTRPDGTAYDVVGSSPEALVKVTGTQAITHPIAGSRPRGKSPEDDVRLAEDLLADPKERSEHVMLVDLGRNDLGRVCQPGTVDVVEFMDVRRYSHVMHLESTVVGELRAGVRAYDVLVSTFPAGTLSGAPKPRALALIEGYEPSRRGVYGGVVGYLDFHGDLDMAIAIRTALIDGGTAHVQAGAGIVADSVPRNEHNECIAKATAVLRAVATASALRRVT
ncbi:anthranilate synthase component I [Knoellia sp. CPCC 206453]|uniref:anthranilate synthase component I n=1 Tax=Knoellia pratensis TaxID=3404796 RepID=UPI00360DF1C7